MKLPTYKSKCSIHAHEIIDGVRICKSGCDYKKARELDRIRKERATGCRYGMPFLVMEGLSLIATGYEEPYTVLRFDDEYKQGLVLDKARIEVLRTALQKAEKWCEEGYCEGMC